MFKKIVVVGMGYVGIPVAAEFTNSMHRDQNLYLTLRLERKSLR